MKKILLFGILVLILLINGCSKEELQVNEQISPQEEAEKTAERFARYWEQADYESMYDLFILELQNKRNKDDFVKFFLAKETLDTVVVRLDKVSLYNENKSYAYYTVSSSIYDTKVPAMKMERWSDEWKVNAFVNFFTDECIEECSPLNCKESECSSETGFKCKYTEIEKCACKKDYDCSYNKPICKDGFCQAKQCDIVSECISRTTQEKKEECESKGFKYIMDSYCSRHRCITKCRQRNSYEHIKIKSTISIDAVAFKDYIELKNFDNDLTHVSLVINENYRKYFENISSNSVLEVLKEEILNENGRDLPKSLELQTIYIYSKEGKWLWYTGKLSDLYN